MTNVDIILYTEGLFIWNVEMYQNAHYGSEGIFVQKVEKICKPQSS